MTDQKPFLNRWSQRKQQAKNADSSASADVSALTDSQLHNLTDDSVGTNGILLSGSAEGLDELHLDDSPSGDTEITQGPSSEDELLLTDDDMPAIDSLAADSDLSAFFNKGVSAALRKSALRHVFQLPQFNVRDGLNDYDGDYTVFEPLGDIVTSDMKWHTARKERARLEAEELKQQELKQQELEQQELEQQELEQQELEQQELEQQETESQVVDTDEPEILEVEATEQALDNSESDHLTANDAISLEQESHEALAIESKDANIDTEINT